MGNGVEGLLKVKKNCQSFISVIQSAEPFVQGRYKGSASGSRGAEAPLGVG